MRRTFVVLALSALLSAPLPAVAHGDSSGHIVWTHRAAPGSEHLVIARADGSGLRTLTRPQPGVVDLDGTLSPSGERVLYGRESEAGIEIRVVGADGRRDRVVPVPCADPCFGPASPTWLGEQRIAYTKVVGPFDGPNESARQAVLWTARPDGTGERRLSQRGIDGTHEDYFARMAPSGRYLTFSRVRNDPFAVALFRMAPDGTDVRQLTPWDLMADNYSLSPARSGPTAGLAVFQTFGKGDPGGTGLDLATVPTDCRSVSDCARRIRYLTTNGTSGGRNANPAWSPDGTRIAFTDRPGIEVENADIWTMRYDGTHWRRVSSSPEFDYRPGWGH